MRRRTAVPVQHFAMSKENKLGMVLGLGLVILIAVTYFPKPNSAARNGAGRSAAPSTDARPTTSTANSPARAYPDPLLGPTP